MLVDSKMLPFYVCLFVNSLDSTSLFCGNGRKIASPTTECQTGKPIALCMIKKALLHLHLLFFLFDHGQIHPIFQTNRLQRTKCYSKLKNINLACKTSGKSDPWGNPRLFIFWKSFSGWHLLFSHALAIGRFTCKNFWLLLAILFKCTITITITKFQNQLRRYQDLQLPNYMPWQYR